MELRLTGCARQTGRRTMSPAPIPGCARRRFVVAVLSVLVSITAADAVPAQTAPAPVSEVVAVDHPNDVGTALDVKWTLSPDDDFDASGELVTGYEIRRRVEGEEEFARIDETPIQTDSYEDAELDRGTRYEYQVIAVGPGGRSAPATTAEAVSPVMQWFRGDRGWLAIIILLVCGSVVGFVAVAKSGRELYVRPIPGLEAVDEAVGRATEMGRSCLFIPGIQDINDIQTVAGVTVLSRVASLTAEFGARLEVPTARSLVMTTARETVASSYLAAGRPDAYREDDVYYLTDEQFGYVASVTATMMEEQPAACFYMGSFYAESLILAETGNAVGAIQVAGTAQPAQLPFFVAACDYTLIGEEFFAASAYLSGEPVQLGSLRGQDVGKILAGLLIVVGCGLASVFGADGASVLFIKDHVLGGAGFLP